MYALLPAAGYGTRFLPWSKALPKEMLPFGDRPVIQEVVAEAAAAGITDMVIVLSEGKEAIRRHFSPDADLDAFLAAKGKAETLTGLNDLIARCRFHYVIQPEMKGLGDAVRCGWAAVPADTPVAVLLPDTVIRGPSPLPAMIRSFRESGRGSVAVQPVSAERATRYGVCGGHETAPGVYELDAMVEKPGAGQVPALRMCGGGTRHMAFAARYVFPAALREILAATPPGKNHEIQLTDAMRTLLEKDGFHAHLLQGQRLDIGTPSGLLEAMGVMANGEWLMNDG